MKKILIALLIGGIVACASNPSLVLNESMTGKEFELKKGEIVEVRLESRLGTGYSWLLDEESGILKAMGEPAIEKKDRDVVGGLDYQVFRYKGVSTGEAVLSYTYKKPWEAGPDEKKVSFRLLVIP